MLTESLTTYLHEQIPLTGAMGITVKACAADSITLTAPLAPNRNHTDTAFGGAISTLGIVAGWTLLHVALRERGVSAKLLIQHSTTDFTRPADGDLEAACGFEPGALAAFLEGLQERRRGRVELAARIYSAGVQVAMHHGSYVAILY